MPRIGLPEILVILFVALLIFGPKNLPKLGSAIGKTVKNVRDGMDGKNSDSAASVDGEGAQAVAAKAEAEEK